jgi:hypothetical protein
VCVAVSRTVQPSDGKVTVHRSVYWFSAWLEQDTDLDSDWQIGNDIGHVVATVFQPPRHPA